MPPQFHLAQLNIGWAKAPVTDPVMADFVDQLDYINAVADRTPGFVWRLRSDDTVATGEDTFGDARIIINMSVWESIDALYDFTYRSDHIALLRGRRDWFEKPESAHLVIWWVPAGHHPSLEEARDRLEYLNTNGPGPEAFTFRQAYDPQGQPLAAQPRAGSECGVE